jgi:hypothetical protein
MAERPENDTENKVLYDYIFVTHYESYPDFS